MQQGRELRLLLYGGFEEEIKEPFKAVLVLDEYAPAKFSVLPTSEPLRLWTRTLEFFRLACFPTPGGDAEEEMIEEINLELASASLR